MEWTSASSSSTNGAKMQQLELFRNYLDIKADFALYRCVNNIDATEAHKKMREVIERLTTPIESEIKDTLLVGPYKLGVIPKRADLNVVAVSALVFDIDEAQGMTFEELVYLASPYAGIIHTTWKHTTQNPRYRLFIHLTQPIEAFRFKAIRNQFLSNNPKLGALIDHACSDIARAYYLFSYPRERAHIAQCFVLMGKPLDPNQYQDLMYMNKVNNSNIHTGDSIEISPVKNGNRNTSLAKLVGGLIARGFNNYETLSKAIEWNENLDEPLDLIELERTYKSIWKTHIKNHPKDSEESNQTNIQNPKNFQIIMASELLASPPPKRDWVIQDFLPTKIVGAIIAAGGTGKSFLAMHIAVSVASGSALFGKYLPTEPRKVIFISGEDDTTELQRRLHKATYGLSKALIQNIDKNLHFMDLAESFDLFTEKTYKGEVSITEVPALICKNIKEKIGSEVGLVIIDPISRFRGGEENLAADTTRFVQALQQIRDQLNSCVLTLHHVNKSSGSNGATQNNARGSSAFIDGVRLVYQLNPLSDSELKQYGDVTTLPKLLTLQSVKANYGKPIEPLLIARRDNGSLELFHATAGDHLRRALLQEIMMSRLSKTKFKETYGDAKGKFGLSEKAILRKLDEFELTKLIKIPNRGEMELTSMGKSLLNP